MSEHGRPFPRDTRSLPAGDAGSVLTPPAESRLRGDIQALRALAVALVVLYHAGLPFLQGGYVGVDVFFVISGYLITKQLVSEHERQGRIDFAAFYARRIRRLLPAAAAMLLVTSAAILAFLSPLEQRALIPALLSSGLYVSNLWFASQATDYLADGTHDNPFLHTWSLSVEEQFYLVWPVLIVLLLSTGTRRRGGGLVPGIAVILALSFMISLVVTATSQPWAFFASPLRAWEFAAGALVLALERSRPRPGPRCGRALAFVGLGLIAGAATSFDSDTPFPGWHALVPVAGAALVLSGGNGQWFERGWASGGVRWLGDSSYSLYLWHWPLLTLPALLYGPLAPVERALCVLAALVCASASYAWLERHFRFHPLFVGSSVRSMILGGALTILVALGAVGLSFLAQRQLDSPEQRSILAAKQDLPRTYADGCHLKYEETSFGDCLYGAKDASQTIVLFGDSHAAQWFPVLDELARRRGFRFVALTKSACPSVRITPWSAPFQRPYLECVEWQDRVVERIRSQRPALVVLANSSRYVPAHGPAKPEDAWAEGLEATLRSLVSAGTSVLIIRDTPWFPVDIPTCLSRRQWVGSDQADCDAPRDEVLGESIYAVERAQAFRHPGVALLDVSDVLCNADKCLSRINGKVAYRDAHHLTAPAVLQTAAVLGAAVDRALSASPTGGLATRSPRDARRDPRPPGTG